MAVSIARFNCQGRPLAVVDLPDRRAAAQRHVRFVFLSELEKVLYGGSTGAIYRLLQRESMERSVLPLKKASVGEGLVTQPEFDAILEAYRETVEDVETRGRVRMCSLVPLPVAVSCAKSFGRSPQAIALLECFSAPLPRQWELLAEQEAHAAADEVDLLLEDELAAEEEVEAPLEAELHYTHVAYEETAEEKATVARYKLDRVPPALEAQLQQYKDWRLQPLNFQRAGNAVVDTTAEGDTATALRFLAYAKEAHDAPPNLKVLGTAALPTIVQAWLEQMVERGLMWSSLSNYVNSLCNLVGWWWDSDGAVEEAAYALDPQPPTALIRLRAQCEQQSKQQRLYAKKPANWLDWDTAQQARVKCARAWADAGRLGHDAKVALLKEYLVLLFHTVMPPDRVGIVRKLRWGYTLKKDAPGAYRLDMTQARFKNSRFYGPSVTSVSALIAPALDAYVSLIAFEMDDQPYVFSRDPTRCQTSSQWSQYCKAIFKKWSGVACPPKMLRASFVTWLRNSEASPEILKQAARAQRHQKETADSDKYDKESNDRLVAAAVRYCEQHAKTFEGGAGAAGGDAYTLVPGQLPEYVFKASGEAEGGKRPFAVALPWIEGAFAPGLELKFPVVVGLAHGFCFRLPTDPSIAGKTLSVTARVDAAAAKRASFKVTSLMMKAPAEPPPEPPADGPPDGAPPLVVWIYEGERAERHGEQRAPVGATVTDDVFGACELLGQVEGRLRLRVDGEERERTAGHVYYAANAPPANAPPANAPPGNAPPVNAPPADAPLGDEEIAQRLAALECAWADAEQTTLTGSANTDVDALHRLLDAMGAEAVELRVPDRVYAFERSRYGARALNATSRAPDGDAFDFDDGFGDEADGFGEEADDRGVPLPEVPYAAANLQVPPGGENPVAEADQQLQIAEQLQERGAQAALADAAAEAVVPEAAVPEAVAEAVEAATEAAMPEAEVAAAEVAEVAVAEVATARCRKRKTPEERAAAAAAKEAAARAKAEAKAAAKAAREEEARRKAAAREEAARRKAAEREEEARRRAAEREAAAAAREAARDATRDASHAGRASLARQIQEAAAAAAQQAVQQVMGALGSQRGSQRGGGRDGSQRGGGRGGSQRGGSQRGSSQRGGSQRGGQRGGGRGGQRGGSQHDPSPPPPSSRGRALKRPRKYGDAGELDDGPASRFRSAPPAPKPASDVASEMGVPAFALPGEEVYAMGLRAGVRMRFRAEVTALRTHFPRIVVRYTASEDGTATHPLALPEMRVAYVTMADVAPRDW